MGIIISKAQIVWSSPSFTHIQHLFSIANAETSFTWTSTNEIRSLWKFQYLWFGRIYVQNNLNPFERAFGGKKAIFPKNKANPNIHLDSYTTHK